MSKIESVVTRSMLEEHHPEGKNVRRLSIQRENGNGIKILRKSNTPPPRNKIKETENKQTQTVTR